MDGGRLSLTTHGPVGLSDTYQTAWWQAQNFPESRITENVVFTPYASLVPSMSLNSGSPSYVTLMVWSRFTAVVCGICVSATASCASSVPVTNVRTSAIGDSGGICENALGSLSGRTAVHGPFKDLDLNQRPAASTKVSAVAGWTSTLPSQLSAKSRSALVPTGT